jgi:hypothetical protein
MSDGNWFDYMPELGDPPTRDLTERPSATTLWAKPPRKPVERAEAAHAVEAEGAILPDGAAPLTEAPLPFILGGKAFFTLVSQKTGTRYTYRVSAIQDGDGWFVSLLTGPDNWANYSYIGLIGSDKRFRTTAKSKLSAESEPVKAFAWTYGWLLRGQEPPSVEIWHAGKCGRCGRKLTVPSSIASGIGPECARKGRAA